MILHKILPLAAVFAAALGATALAGQGDNRSTSNAVVDDGAPPPGHVNYSAVVNAKGKLVRSVGAIRSNIVKTDSIGSFEVDFQNKIAKCAYVATVGEVGNSGEEPASFITVVGRASRTKGVYVQTFDGTGAHVAFPFHLEVAC